MRRLIAGIVLASAAATGALAADAVVRQANHLFEPSRLTVKRGTTVHFTNAENVVHHAYSDGGGFASAAGRGSPSAGRRPTASRERR
jgi:plastocyanin